MVAVFRRGLLMFCPHDPVSFHEIKEGRAFLAAVGQRGENGAPGIGTLIPAGAPHSELIGRRELRAIVWCGRTGSRKQGEP